MTGHALGDDLGGQELWARLAAEVAHLFPAETLDAPALGLVVPPAEGAKAYIDDGPIRRDREAEERIVTPFEWVTPPPPPLHPYTLINTTMPDDAITDPAPDLNAMIVDMARKITQARQDWLDSLAAAGIPTGWCLCVHDDPPTVTADGDGVSTFMFGQRSHMLAPDVPCEEGGARTVYVGTAIDEAAREYGYRAP